MPSLAVGASAQINISPNQSVNFSSSFGTNFRYTFNPYNPEAVAPQNSSRSYGPAAQNVTAGPFVVAGLMTIYNESGSSLTYQSLFQGIEFGQTTIYNTATFSAAVAMSPANANITMSPTGTGTVTIGPATGGTINNMDIGTTARKGGSFSAFSLNSTDQSGTPGNVTLNNVRGRVAIAAGASSVTVTNSQGVTGGSVFAIINQATADATLTQIVRVATGLGSFTIYGNANATANTVVDFIVIGA